MQLLDSLEARGVHFGVRARRRRIGGLEARGLRRLARVGGAGLREVAPRLVRREALHRRLLAVVRRPRVLPTPDTS